MDNIKPWEDLTIQDDYMFKLVMRSKRICKTMIEKILNIRLTDIRYIDEEKTLKPRYESKGVRLDVYVEGSGEVFEIEMQVRQPETGELSKRTRYYQAMIDSERLMAGQKYKMLPTSYIIFICPFDPFRLSRHIYTFRNLCVEDTGLELNDKTTKVFVNSTGTADDVAPDVKAFLDYVNGVISDDAFVREIDDEILRVKKLEEERVAYMTYEMKIEEERELAAAKGREEGREEGRKEGRKEGEGRLLKLFDFLMANGKQDEIKQATQNPESLPGLYSKYGII